MSDNDFETPVKGVQQKDPMQTATGIGQSKKMVQSKYEVADQKNQNQTHLSQIQAQIRECGNRLREIQIQSIKETDKYSQRSLDLQQQRNNIRKRIMDLDLQHKTICANQMKQSRQRDAQERQKRQKQAQEQREKRQQQLQERLEKSRRERQQKLKQYLQPKEKVQGGEQQKNDQGTDNLQRSRRKARIAEIELELAQSRLRRSRIASLNAELDYLRTSYYLPRYYYPYYGYPYLRDYYYYPSSYYGYYPYSYPYLSYRWWL